MRAIVAVAALLALASPALVSPALGAAGRQLYFAHCVW